MDDDDEDVQDTLEALDEAFPEVAEKSDVPGLGALFQAMLEECLEHDMKEPFILTAIAANGGVLVSRWAKGEAHEALEGTTLFQHFEAPGFRMPVTLLVVDATGQPRSSTITPESFQYLQ